MNSAQIIEKIRLDSRVSQSELAKRAGYKSQTNITGILHRGTTLKVSNFDRLLHALGYKIVVMPDSTPTPIGTYEVNEIQESK